MGNESGITRKILVMTFDDSYLKDIGKIIAKKTIQLVEDIGFCNYENQIKGIIYTFLSSKNRRTWLHHYIGTYGTIIINEGINIIDNTKEIENILSSKILRKRPLLLVYDKNKILEKDNRYLEMLRFSLSNKKINYNVMYIDFKNNHLNSELLYGLDWLYKQILKT